MRRVETIDDLNEHELPDDYPIFGGYLDVADDQGPFASPWHGITAKQLKEREGIKVLKNCDIFGRQDLFDRGVI